MLLNHGLDWDENTLDDILFAAKSGKVVPIIGSELLEVSHGGRRQSLQRLMANHLAARLRVPAEDLPQGDELDEVSRRFLANRKGNLKELRMRLWRTADELLDNVDLPDPLLKLAEVGAFRFFITTTCDRLMMRALNEVRCGGREQTQGFSMMPSAPVDLDEAAGQSNVPAVYHIFGDVGQGPAGFAATQEDLLEWVTAMQEKRSELRTLFGRIKRSHLLILGCGFSGWLARFFLRAQTGKKLSDREEDYIVGGKTAQDRKLIEFLHCFGCNTKIFPGDAIQFIDELHQRWMQLRTKTSDSSRPVSRGLGDRTGGRAVFISYAREDQAVARQIAAAIEGARVSVFIGDRSLDPGEDFEARIRERIRDCSLFIPILSRRAIRREGWAHDEWRAALKRYRRFPPDRVFIMPLAVDDVAPDDSGVLDGFRKMHWTRLSSEGLDSGFLESVFKHHRGNQLEQS